VVSAACSLLRNILRPPGIALRRADGSDSEDVLNSALDREGIAARQRGRTRNNGGRSRKEGRTVYKPGIRRSGNSLLTSSFVANMKRRELDAFEIVLGSRGLADTMRRLGQPRARRRRARRIFLQGSARRLGPNCSSSGRVTRRAPDA